MADIKQWQDCVSDLFLETFGRTPLRERLDDIFDQATRLHRFSDVIEMREKTGNLLSSLLQLTYEMDWDPGELLQENFELIKRRSLQYKTLGRKKRVAILGGAFDPITKGHVEVLKFVLNCSGRFDEAWLMPCYSHMYSKQMQAPEDRLEMCKLAVQHDRRLKVIDVEIKNKLAGETYWVVKSLQEDSGFCENYDFSLIIGQDNANTFDKWVNYEKLVNLISFIVVPRKGEKRDESVNWYLESPHLYMNPENDIPEISSTDIRDTLSRFYKNNGEGDYNFLKENLDKDVLKYIMNKKLYAA